MALPATKRYSLANRHSMPNKTSLETGSAPQSSLASQEGPAIKSANQATPIKKPTLNRNNRKLPQNLGNEEEWSPTSQERKGPQSNIPNTNKAGTPGEGKTATLEYEEPQPIRQSIEEHEAILKDTKNAQQVEEIPPEEQRKLVAKNSDSASGLGGNSFFQPGKNAASHLSNFADTVRDLGNRATTMQPQGALHNIQAGLEGITNRFKAKKGDVASKLEKNILSYLTDVSELKGLEVSEEGQILDYDGNTVGILAEGNPNDLAGQIVGEGGEILDEDGDLIGRVELLGDKAAQYADAFEEVVEYSVPSLKDLASLPLTEEGSVKDKNGRVLGHLVEGNPDDLVGWAADENGEILDEYGDLIGRVELMCPDQVEESAGEAEPIGGLLIPGVAILRGREINENGKIFNDDGEQLGQAVEGCDPQHLSGKIPNELGQVLDITGEVIGHVEPVPGEAANIAMRELEDKKSFLKKKGGFKDIETEEEEDTDSSASQENSLEIPDISTLHGLKCTKFGYIVGENGVPVGELIEGNAKKLSQGGFQLDDRGQFWDNHSNVLGIAQSIPIEEEDQRLFADFEDLFVVNDGWVENATGDRVGRVVDGEIKKLLGRAVDDDGDVLDKRGNVIGHAEPWEEPEPETENFDFSFLEGLSPNNLGFVLRSDSVLIGRVTEGNLTRISGRTIDLEGQIWSDDGEVIGRVEIVPEEEREVSGLFSDSGELMVRQDGLVETEERMIVGRTIDGDLGKLRGKAVDDDGDIMDKHGNVIGFAEPYIPPDNPREPEEDTSELEEMSVNNFESVESETETEPELSPEESERQAKEKHNRDLSKKISTVIQQTLDSMEPPYKQITAHLEKADRVSQEDLNEEKLAQAVIPLIEDAGNMLQECKSTIRALDPDGSIAASAKAYSDSHEATPEEHQLADLLKQLTQIVTTTIDNGRQQTADMPHAKKKLNPLWTLLSEPLFQIIAAVGLLLSGVLGLVNNRFDELGLGGLVRGLFGSLGMDNLIKSFGLSKLGVGK